MANSEERMIAQFREMATGWISDAFDRINLSGWSEGVVPLSRTQRRFAGRAVTVQYLPSRGSGPKLPNHYEIMRNIAQPGEVLIIAALGTPCWLMGENQAHVAMYRGLAGVCVDGCVRDWDEVAELAIPVFARGAGVRPYSTHLELAGVNVPVAFAGAQVRPHDIVVGDCDGLIVVPGDRAEEVLQHTLEIAAVEKEAEVAIANQASLEELAAISRKKKAKA
jgi:4-hydroxy-4-methyl-2-oxoglutarate aldolase